MAEVIESIPANWYCDPEVFAHEQKRIFARNWIFISHTNALLQPGDYITDRIAGQSVVLIRDQDQEIKGFLNLCRHRASPLCIDKAGRLQQFTCPYHAWRYDLNGTLLQTPGFSGAIDKTQLGLLPVRVEIWNDLIFVCLDKSVCGLEQWLGDLPGVASAYPDLSELEFDSVRSNDCQANWKNYSDNSAEGYHLGSIHPALSRSLVKNQTHIQTCENGKFIGFNVEYKNHTGESSPGLWIYKFPGLLMHFSMNSFNIERIIAVNERRARMHRWFWFKPQVSVQERKETIEFSTQVMEEDIGICSHVQKNLEGGVYTTGLLSPEREPGTIFFQKCVREALAGLF